MIKVRKSKDRGHAEHGWLKSYHTFSFADYYDPKNMNFSVLRVINEDWIAPGRGFGTHPHRDMEIITYVIEGELEHKDSMGNSTRIRPGEVQRMSAGTGVAHSEYNPSSEQATHLLQIWIMPDKTGHTPSYGQKSFVDRFGCSDLIMTASRSGKDDTVNLNQDVDLYIGKVQAAGEKLHKTFAHRHLWVQVVKGEVSVNGEALEAGDGAGLHEESQVALRWSANSEFLLFDMP